MGLCPVLAATALSAVGLGILAPIWMWLSGGLLVAGLVGYAFDYRCHRRLTPVLLFVFGGILLWVGRYSPFGGTGWQGWPLWGSGGLLVLSAFVLNLRVRSSSCVVKAVKPAQSI
jgi:hypothetical protein